MKTFNDHMRAIRLRHHGGPEALLYEQAEVPHIGAGEVLVRVCAAAITPTELSWLGKISRPIIPSHEMSGVVAAIGANVSDLKVGDAVYGLPAFDRDGAAAEYVLVRPSEVALKPPSIGHVQSAALPLSALTAWQALRIHGSLSAGQRVLIHGGAGGVGSLRFSLPSISEPRLLQPPPKLTPVSLKSWAPIALSITPMNHSIRSSTASIWCWTPSAVRRSRAHGA
jgi:NADPH:quinone reductase-like Zn-dependent oxidoreductase